VCDGGPAVGHWVLLREWEGQYTKQVCVFVCARLCVCACVCVCVCVCV
jgi:hypothetical protein